MSVTAMRLFDKHNNRSVVVDLASGKAWADHNGDGRVEGRELLNGAERERALRAAAQVKDLFVAPVPGTRTPDDAFVVDGVASSKEIATLAAGGAVDSQRSKLKQHLDFFDSDGSDKLGFGEVYGGFRASGFGAIAAGIKSTFVSVLFGKARDGFQVDIDAIGAKRYADATGIYDKNGRINEARLAEFEVFFDAEGGALSQNQLMTLLQERGTGTVSKGQFKSLFTVTEKINGDQTVTKAQFRALFDGSLLWQAASLTDAEGHRGLRD